MDMSNGIVCAIAFVGQFLHPLEHASTTLAGLGPSYFEVEYQRVLACREALTEYVAR